MFRKSIEAIIAEGVSNITKLAQEAEKKSVEAQTEVRKCQGEIQALVNLAKQVPEKVFDRYSNLMVATVEVRQPARDLSFVVDGYMTSLRGLMGGDSPKVGKYRVLVLLELID